MESLYRKYRPLTFSDVVGQTHIVSTLENAVLEGKCSHAYLFCGPRGTGKTTMARILAKALMCDMGPGHLPDGTCEQCEAIANGEHPDVYELDAASRTGVDNVREVIDSASYAPVKGRAKVYIIDEVHMLTNQAFNALLKTLEEPPEHVTFIMCTTDPQVILETILSRVQRFDFHAISSEDIKGRLLYVCDKEGFAYDEEAIDLVVRHARGGMRDALSMLEQLSVFGSGKIRLEDARDLLGSASASKLQGITLALAKRDVVSLFEEVATLNNEGQDLLQFTRDLSQHLRNVYMVSVAGANYELIDAIGQDMDILKSQSAAFETSDRLARALEVLGEAASSMKYATDKRLVLEVALTKLARPESSLTLEALNERVVYLENKLKAIETGGVSTNSVASQQTPQTSSVQIPQASAPQRAAVPQAPAAANRQVPRPTPAQKVNRPAPTPAAPSLGVAPRVDEFVAKKEVQPPKPVINTTQKNTGAENSSEWQKLWGYVIASTSKPYIKQMIQGSFVTMDNGETLTICIPKDKTFAFNMFLRKDTQQLIMPSIKENFGPRNLEFIQEGDATPIKPLKEKATPEVKKAAPAMVEENVPSISPAAKQEAAPTSLPQQSAAESPSSSVSYKEERVPVDIYDEQENFNGSNTDPYEQAAKIEVPQNLTDAQEEIFNTVASVFGEGVKVVETSDE